MIYLLNYFEMRRFSVSRNNCGSEIRLKHESFELSHREVGMYYSLQKWLFRAKSPNGSELSPATADRFPYIHCTPSYLMNFLVNFINTLISWSISSSRGNLYHRIFPYQYEAPLSWHAPRPAGVFAPTVYGLATW